MNQPMRDDMDFKALMGDVQPLGRTNLADTGKRPSQATEAQQARREAAQAVLDERNFLSDDFVDLLPPYDPMEFLRQGVQQPVVDKLRQGGYPVQAQLHLIRHPLAECRRLLFPFVHDAYCHDLRSVMIVHGRGREMDSPANVLRSYLAKWLQQFDEVQAFTSAQSSDGGLGATWVMLRKSERAKSNNRERQQKRRG